MASLDSLPHVQWRPRPDWGLAERLPNQERRAPSLIRSVALHIVSPSIIPAGEYSRGDQSSKSPGLDDMHTDDVGRDFVIEGLAHPFDRKFRGLIRAAVGQGDTADDATDVDDHAAPTFTPTWQHHANRLQRAPNVGVELSLHQCVIGQSIAPWTSKPALFTSTSIVSASEKPGRQSLNRIHRVAESQARGLALYPLR